MSIEAVKAKALGATVNSVEYEHLEYKMERWGRERRVIGSEVEWTSVL